MKNKDRGETRWENRTEEKKKEGRDKEREREREREIERDSEEDVIWLVCLFHGDWKQIQWDGLPNNRTDNHHSKTQIFGKLKRQNQNTHKKKYSEMRETERTCAAWRPVCLFLFCFSLPVFFSFRFASFCFLIVWSGRTKKIRLGSVGFVWFFSRQVARARHGSFFFVLLFLFPFGCPVFPFLGFSLSVSFVRSFVCLFVCFG